MACCNKHCCGSINRCCKCVSTFDRCGNLHTNPDFTPPTFNQPTTSTLSNIRNYAYLINSSISLDGDGEILLAPNLVNGNNISISGNVINLKRGNYEIIFSANITPSVSSDNTSTILLELNGENLDNSMSTITNLDTRTQNISGNIIVGLYTDSTLKLKYIGTDSITIDNVRLTIKMLA